jgi:hypothetical protein
MVLKVDSAWETTALVAAAADGAGAGADGAAAEPTDGDGAADGGQ